MSELFGHSHAPDCALIKRLLAKHPAECQAVVDTRGKSFAHFRAHAALREAIGSHQYAELQEPCPHA